MATEKWVMYDIGVWLQNTFWVESYIASV